MHKDYVRKQKSVDSLIIMKNERLLLSGTCDGKIRFWDLKELTSENQLIYTMKVFNYAFELD